MPLLNKGKAFLNTSVARDHLWAELLEFVQIKYQHAQTAFAG